MKKWVWLTAFLIFVLLIAGWLDPARRLAGLLGGDSFYRGKPTRYWNQQLRSADPTTSEEARQALDDGGVASVPVLIELLEQKSDEDWDASKVRWMAAEALGHIGVEARSATGPLIVALSDLDLHVRAVAASSLPAVDAPAEQAVPALTELIGRGPSVGPIRALSEYGLEAKPAVPELIRLAGDEQLNSEIRWNAVRTLGKIGAGAVEAIPVLVEQLKNPIPSIREHAAEALGDLGPAARETAESLLPLLSDTVTKVRRDAARSLGQIQAPPELAGEPLKELLTDPEQIVREAAHKALQTVAPELLEAKPSADTQDSLR
jgi:HEAT repeat protein